MPRLVGLTDEEVFGPTKPKGLTDAEVFGQPATASGVPVIQPRRRTFGERFQDNLEDAQRATLLGAGADAIEASQPGPGGAYAKERNRDTAEAFRLRSEADKFKDATTLAVELPFTDRTLTLHGKNARLAAGGAALAGQLAGSVSSPEGWIGPGKTAVTRILANAGINAATDVPVQGLQNIAGTHEGYDPARTAIAAGTGALIQGGFEGVRATAPGSRRSAHQAPGSRATGLTDAEVFGQETVAAPPAAKATGLTDAQVFGGGTAPTQGPIAQLVRAEAARQGIDPGVALTIAELESPGLKTDLKNPKSTAAGLFQFTDETWKRMGGGDKLDPAESARLGVQLMRENGDVLGKELGRAPEGWELYLAHQQGAGGASALLKNPDMNAIEALKAHGVSAKRARAAILNNGGRADMTAAEFAGLWRDRYSKAGGVSSSFVPDLLAQ